MIKFNHKDNSMCCRSDIVAANNIFRKFWRFEISEFMCNNDDRKERKLFKIKNVLTISCLEQ